MNPFFTTKLLSIICIIFFINNSNAQTPCEYMNQYSTCYGFQPLPKGDSTKCPEPHISLGMPNACKGQPYNFGFHILIPADIKIQGIVYTIDSVLLTNPASIDMPPAFSLTSSNTNYIFYPNQPACLGVAGTSNLVGTYNPKFDFTFFTNITNVAYSFQYTFDVTNNTQNCEVAGIESSNNTLIFNGLQINPNPITNRNFNINFNATQPQPHSQLYITDIAGKVVFEQKLQNISTGNNRFELNLPQNLPAGTYFCSLLSNHQKNTTLIQVQH